MRTTTLLMTCCALWGGCSVELGGLAATPSTTGGSPIGAADAGMDATVTDPDPGAPAPGQDSGIKQDAGTNPDGSEPVPQPPDDDASNVPPPEPEADASTAPPEPPFELLSSAIVAGGTFPEDHTCDGDDQSPPLMWLGAPSGTKSFAIVITDLDGAGTGGGGSTGGSTGSSGGTSSGASTGGASTGSGSGGGTGGANTGSGSGGGTGGASTGSGSGSTGGANSGSTGGANSGGTRGNGAGGSGSGSGGNSSSGGSGANGSGSASGGNSGGPGGGTTRGLELELEADAGLAQWVIWDVAAATTQLPQGVVRGALPLNVPGAKQVRGLAPLGLAGGNNYAGPCPGRRVAHQYTFRIYALGVATLPGARTDGRPAAVVTLIESQGAVLGTATLSASYTGQ